MTHEKIFAIGFNKTGTVSLHQLFQSLGLRSFHGHRWRYGQDLELLNAHDCFADGPALDVQPLDRLFPGARFILQVRDLDGWVCSRLAHIERHEEDSRSNRSPEWDVTQFSVTSWIKKRNEYHLRILSYFADRSGDLLIVNFIRDPLAANKICHFLGYEGEYERPKLNQNPYRMVESSYLELLRTSMAELGVPSSERHYDIYCPSLVEDRAWRRFPCDTGHL